MNSTENPLVPQGSFLDQKNRGRARVKIAVFVVLAIHGIGLLALLMQGCGKPGSTTKTADTPTNSVPETLPTTSVAPEFIETNAVVPIVTQPDLVTAWSNTITMPPADPTNTTVSPSLPDTGVTTPPILPGPNTPTTQVTGGTEHKIAKGETYSSLAKKYHVTPRAIQDANPGIDPTRLKPDQAIKIPAPAPAAPSAPKTTAPETATNGKVYKVASGDTLSRIATRFGTTVPAIRKENNLKTERILVGQTLKIPAKAASGTTGSPGSGR